MINLDKNNQIFDVNYDVIIVGAGAAGITMAVRLSKNGKKVALIEGGNLDYSDESQILYKAKTFGDPYFDLEYSRLRYFGGSTNHWGGWCRPFENIDFKRGYLGEEFLWPLNFLELQEYLNDACEILEIPNSFKDKKINNSNIRKIEFQFSPPVNFRDKYLKILNEDNNVDIFINSNLIDIKGNNKRINQITLKGYSGNELNLSTKNLVFSMGGIENSRYLLWFKEKYNNKFFDTNVPIGKYWMEHPHFTLGQIIIKKDVINNGYYAIDEVSQKKAKILNCGFRLEELNYSRSKKLIKDLICVAPSLGNEFLSLLNKNVACGVRIRAAWEQAPNQQNQIILDKETDIFETPKAILKWKKYKIDRETILQSLKQLNNFLFDFDVGRLNLQSWLVDNLNYPENDELAGNHHMGGTRMHFSKKFGVVDLNCKVYGSENLYIAGSSIFTTGGHNNPTLPIVQFSLRLADHLSL